MASNKKAAKVAAPVFSNATVKDYNTIIEPLVTEKSMKALQGLNKVTVKVAPTATADEVKRAFQAIFNVKVDKVNIANVRGHAKRVGRFEGEVSGFRKAIVTLAEGEALDLFKQQA
jgi:large subunit ribosomal protein L23